MVGDMLKTAIEICGRPAKAIALECGYSEDAIYAACNEIRPIPTQAREKISSMNTLAGMAVAMEATGYRIFEYLRVDRHICSLFNRLVREDKQADEALQKLSDIIMDKPSREDLTHEDIKIIESAVKEVSDRITHDFNFLVEIEAKYQIKVTDNLIKKEKSPVLAHRRQ